MPAKALHLDRVRLDRLASADAVAAARVTVTVYVFVAIASSASTFTVMTFAPTSKLNFGLAKILP